MSYDLWYWPTVPGRGEFVRLALEAGGIPYRDRAREAGVGAPGLAADMERRRPRPFAPPYLVADGAVIAQTATILLFLGDRHGLAPADPAGRIAVHQHQLTIADMVTEAHDTHHPIDVAEPYEAQRAEAARRAAAFRTQRMPKFLAHFEQVIDGADWLDDGRWTYADLSLFQLVEGLAHAFPRRMATLGPRYPRVMRVRAAVARLPGVAAYLASDRRLPFGDGIFRHYPALDGD